MDGNISLDRVLAADGSECEPGDVRRDVDRALDPAIWKHIFHYVRTLVDSQVEAEDITQEAFVVLFREQRAGRPVERIHSWMRTVARHLAYQRYHEQRRILRVPLDTGEVNGVSIPWELPDTRPSPEKQVIDQAMLRLSAKVLCEFSKRDRECILMYFRGYDFQQIASVVGLSRWTARRLTLKALKRFQSRMNPSR